MSAPLIFRVYKNDQIYVVKQFVTEDRIIFGSGGGAHISLDSNEVSAIHCLVEKRQDAFYLCDLGSAQGTYVNGAQALDQLIQSGDSFSIGPFKIFFLVGHQKNLTSPLKAGVSSALLAPESLPVHEPAVTPAVADANRAAKAAASEKINSEAVALTTTSKATNLKDVLKVGTGPRIEVVVSWHERILETYHFQGKSTVSIGPHGDVVVPAVCLAKTQKLLAGNGTQIEIQITHEMQAEILRDGEFVPVTSQKAFVQTQEACFINLPHGLQLAIRFAPKAPGLIYASPFVIGISEFIGILAALILAVVTSLIVSVNKPKDMTAEEEIQILAQVVFSKPPPPLPSEPPVQEAATPPPVPLTPPEPPQKPPEVTKVNLAEKNQTAQNKGDPTLANSQGASEASQSSGQASEIKPKDPKLKSKMFTSTKQGGAVKTGANNAANAQSKQPDLQNSGLLAAFGTGGARNKLDQAYSGSGELIGAGEKATGSSGFNADRAGQDLGSRAKDTGAGGMGTATQGISGIGTQGRGTGMAGMGNSSGFGDKSKIQIAAGGSEEAFTGTIDREAVRRVVKSALAQFKACYEREYRMNSKLEGKVVLQWEIHEQGIPRNAIVIRNRSTLNNTAVEECVKNRMLALKFPEPPPGTAAEVTYPFIFQGQKL